MSVASLRERALAHNQGRVETYAVCLDPAKAERLVAARQALQAAQQAVDAPENAERTVGGHTIPQPLTDALDAAQAEVEAAEQAAADDVVILHFGLYPTSYQRLIRKHTTGKGDKAETDWDHLSDELTAGCYRRATDADGADLELTWEQVSGSLINHGDRQIIESMLARMHTVPALLDFRPPTSGPAATN